MRLNDLLEMRSASSPEYCQLAIQMLYHTPLVVDDVVPASFCVFWQQIKLRDQPLDLAVDADAADGRNMVASSVSGAQYRRAVSRCPRSPDRWFGHDLGSSIRTKLASRDRVPLANRRITWTYRRRIATRRFCQYLSRNHGRSAIVSAGAPNTTSEGRFITSHFEETSIRRFRLRSSPRAFGG